MSVHHALDTAATPTGTAPPAGLTPLLLPATLLLTGQLFYIVVTLFHAGGDANDHHGIFAEYASSGTWSVVHLGQFAGMAIFIAGLLATFAALRRRTGTVPWVNRFGTAWAAAALALYGALQAVDGIALKRAVEAWAGAPQAEEAARFASAEAVRWLEWGVRSYHNIALGLALLLLAAAFAHVARIPRPVGVLVGLAGATHLVQGWVVGADGFSPALSTAIVLAYALHLVWMTWLVVAAWGVRGSRAPSRAR